MDHDQPSAHQQRTRTVSIHLHVTTGGVFLSALLIFFLVMLFAAVIESTADVAAQADDPTSEVLSVAPVAADAAAWLLPPAPLSYPPPMPAPAEIPSPSPAPAAALPAPVGLEEVEPPVFNPVRLVEGNPSAVSNALNNEQQAVVAMQPVPTTDEFWLDLDGPTATAGPQVAAPTVESVDAPSPVVVADSRSAGASDAPTAAPVLPTPVPVPVVVLSGQVSWSISQSPIELSENLLVAPGAILTIDPGVEIFLAQGVSITVRGLLQANGTAEAPVRLAGLRGGVWDGIFADTGGSLALSWTTIRDGGAGGTLIASDGGKLALSQVQIRGNEGQIRADNAIVELTAVEMVENRIPYGSPLQFTYTRDSSITLVNNRITANRLPPGAPTVRIEALNAFDGITLKIVGNLLHGFDGAGMELTINALLSGEIVCNALIGGTVGLSLLSDAPRDFQPGLTIAVNAIEGQTPSIIPFYLEQGIGRGATSALPISMINNWWDSNLGPYSPDSNPDGRGEAVGPNIQFAPWMGERPPCAPLS